MIKCFEEDFAAKTLTYAKKRRYEHIFKTTDGKMDPKRSQSFIPSKEQTKKGFVKDLLNMCKETAQNIDPDWIVAHPAFLYSGIDGGEQEIHKDIIDDDHKNLPDNKQFGVGLLAFDSGTKLRVEDKIINIPIGFLFIMKGDMVHAGVNYTAENYRLHFILQYPDYQVTMRNNVQVAFQCDLCKKFYCPKGWPSHKLRCKASTESKVIEYRERQQDNYKKHYINIEKDRRKVKKEQNMAELQKEKAELDNPSCEHDDDIPISSMATSKAKKPTIFNVSEVGNKTSIAQTKGHKKRRNKFDSDGEESDSDNDSVKKGTKKKK